MPGKEIKPENKKPAGERPAEHQQDLPDGRTGAKSTPLKNKADAASSATLPYRPKVAHGPLGTLALLIGEALYTLGFSAEYLLLNFWRRLREIGIFIGQLLALAGSRLGGMLWGLLRGMGQDITRPFSELGRRRRLLRQVRSRAQRRAQAGEGGAVKSVAGFNLRTFAQFVAQVVVSLMPLAAAVVLVFTVYQVVGMGYALQVSYNGEVLGYVADQTVVDSAKSILRDRIRLAPGQETTDWQLNPAYSIRNTDEYTTTSQLVNNILLVSTEDESDLTEAIGIEIGGQLYAVTDEADELREYLDNLIGQYEAQAEPGADVDFVMEVALDNPDEEPVYFISSVEPAEDIIERLSATTSEEQRYTANGELTLTDIAHAQGLALDTLLTRNPELVAQVEQAAEETEGTDDEQAILDAEYVPAAGTELLIQRAQPFLQVQTSIRVQSVEPIAYNTITEHSDEYISGTSRVTQEGVPGEREVWDDYVYIDGELDHTVRVDELTVVRAEPTDEVVVEGTRELEAVPNASSGAGGYMFPVPSSSYSSRGMGGGHRGIDINAAAGASIFACADGVVTTAGWHYSFGNYIVIDHGNSVTTLYAHCSALFVSAGQVVSMGDNIAAVGSTGNSNGNHLHLEVTLNGALVNPVDYVGYPYG